MKKKSSKMQEETGKTLNRLAREQLKLRLLQDIRVDIEICRLENLDYKEYLLELKEIIDGFLLGHESCIEDCPTIDAVPVVRCKDCKHYNIKGEGTKDNTQSCHHTGEKKQNYALCQRGCKLEY